jgi:outer membrane protein OmpA-like peptidoglycan-associated protein
MRLTTSGILILISFTLSFHCMAQENVHVWRSEFKTSNHSEFRTAWKHVKKGNKYYKKGKGAFQDAMYHYSEAYAYNDSNPQLNYKLGVCHVFSDEKGEAIKYLLKAYEQYPEVSKDIHFMLARGYHLNLQFDKAIDEYTKYHQSLRRRKRRKLGDVLDKYIEECNSGKVLVNNPLRVVIGNLGDKINSPFDDYAPVLSVNDSLMFFTSRRPRDSRSKLSPIDNKFYEDVYTAVKKDGQWGNARLMGKAINTKHNDAAVGLSIDNKELYIYNGYERGGEIYVSRQDEGRWTSPRKLPRRLRSRTSRETSMCISHDGKKFYFVSDREDSYGGKDIFVSTLNDNGRWGKPENIGEEINTPYDEEGVSLSANDSILYFSSKGHNTMGGFDVFKSKLGLVGKWGKPENIGFPINTPDDDVFFNILKNGRQGYYSATREGGMGGKDIYKFTFIGSEKEMVLNGEDNLIGYEFAPFDPLFSNTPEKLTIDTAFYLIGSIVDAKDQKPLMAKMELIDMDHSQVVATEISDTTGNYKMKLPAKKNYGINIIAKDYMLYIDIVKIASDNKEELITKNFALNKVEVGSKVILRNIFFESGKAKLKPESFTELNNVLQLMQENATLRIEVSGHTDNVGSLASNTKLSQARAKSVVDYLIKKGVDKSRLEFKGYAFSQPIESNATATGRQQNRRVEFKILSK